ncbi:MAG: CVNH domain-containing protein [Acetobacteraceae bacterium]|nr:CVNH domain-containing protein [Acetobacteraceae bacterium]
MRHALWGALAAALLVGGCQPGPGFGGGGFGGWPGGSWAETCRDAQLRGGTLIARCRERDGDWRLTSIRYTDCPGGRVRNDNGRLECEGGWGGGWRPDDDGWGGGGWGGGWAGGGPRGSWVESCRQAQVSGNRLTALCRERDGGWNRSSIIFTQCRGNRVANRDGWLRCEG